MKALTIYTYGSQCKARPPQTPHVRIDCRSLTNPMGRVDSPAECRAFVMDSPGFPSLLGHAVATVMGAFQHADTLDCGIYCLYGRHRSPALASVLVQVLAPLGVEAKVVNL